MSVVDINRIYGSINLLSPAELPVNSTEDRIDVIAKDFFDTINDSELGHKTSIGTFSEEIDEHCTVRDELLRRLSEQCEVPRSLFVIRNDSLSTLVIDDERTTDRKVVLASCSSGNELVVEECKVNDAVHTTIFYIVPPGYMFEGADVTAQVMQFMAEAAVKNATSDQV